MIFNFSSFFFLNSNKTNRILKEKPKREQNCPSIFRKREKFRKKIHSEKEEGKRT